jgi:hypothetical protein
VAHEESFEQAPPKIFRIVTPLYRTSEPWNWAMFTAEAENVHASKTTVLVLCVSRQIIITVCPNPSFVKLIRPDRARLRTLMVEVPKSGII